MPNGPRIKIGDEFGYLKITRFLGQNKRGARLWECHCICGNTTTVTTTRLRLGRTRSCGCLVKEKSEIGRDKIHQNYRAKRIYPSAFIKLYNRYKHAALRRRYSFDLSQQQFYILTQRCCFYCGTLPEQQIESDALHPEIFFYNGVDRYDNTLGYTVENSVPCCTFCNLAKNTLSKEAFIAKIEKIYNYQKADKRFQTDQLTTK